MKIQEGNKYSTSEMQEFFGVSKDNWKKKKEKLLLHFSRYYQYEILYNEKDRRKRDYHIIKKIKDYEPPKGKRERQNEIYSKKILEVIKADGLQTAKNVSRIIQDDKEIVALDHKEGTIYEYTRVNMRTMFGKEILAGGSYGLISEKIWCRVDMKDNIYIPLGEEHKAYLFDRFHSNRKEIEEGELSICEDHDNGLITQAEMRERISDNSFRYFLNALGDFKMRYGYRPIKVPRYVIPAFMDNEY